MHRFPVYKQWFQIKAVYTLVYYECDQGTLKFSNFDCLRVNSYCSGWRDSSNVKLVKSPILSYPQFCYQEEFTIDIFVFISVEQWFLAGGHFALETYGDTWGHF